MSSLYKDYSDFLHQYFPYKVQKIMVDAGFTCPNRDGKLSVVGCSFCRNDSFSPGYCRSVSSITEQIEAGKLFVGKRYKEMKYLVYFQSYSNTYGSIDVLKKRYEEALSAEDVVGIVISTRPDCINEPVLDLLKNIQKDAFVMLELGVESCYDKTLKAINRGHSFEVVKQVLQVVKQYEIPISAHLIFGLPNETVEDIIAEASIIGSLPIDVLKFHQLQILKDTPIVKLWQEHPEQFIHFTAQSYTQLVAQFINKLPDGIYIDRFVSQVPLQMLIYPKWGLKNEEIEKMVEAELAQLKKLQTF